MPNSNNSFFCMFVLSAPLLFRKRVQVGYENIINRRFFFVPGRLDALRTIGNFDGTQSRHNEESADKRDTRQAQNVVLTHQQRPGGGQRPLHVSNQYRHCQNSIWVPACCW